MGETTDTSLTSEQEYAVLLKFLRKQNLKETEEVLRREAGITSSDGLGLSDHSNPAIYKHGYERQSPTDFASTKIVSNDLHSAERNSKQANTIEVTSISSTEVDSTTDDLEEKHYNNNQSPLAQQRIPVSVPMLYCSPSLFQPSPPLIYPFPATLLGSRFPFITMVPNASTRPQIAPAPVIPVPMGDRMHHRHSSISSMSSICDSPRFDVSDGSMELSESESVCSYAELRQFADDFKAKRVKLGYTQGGVGSSLAEKGFCNFAQSTISRFEQMQLSPRNAAAIKKILEKWLMEVENPHLKLNKSSEKLNCRKRKRRIVFSSESRKFLDDMFNCNPKPDRHTIELVAKELSLLPEEVRIWFCNKRQKERSSMKCDGLCYPASSSPASSGESQGYTRSPSPPSNFSIEELSKSSCSSPGSCDSPQYQPSNFADVCS